MHESTKSDSQREIITEFGNFELEISLEGENGHSENYNSCEKNPGHTKFIPIREFNKSHLPSRYQCQDMEDMVRALADITVRVSLSYISKERPETNPNSGVPYSFSEYRGKSGLFTGTGLIISVKKFTQTENSTCPCSECEQAVTKRVEWGQIMVRTVSHVVFDQSEADKAKCSIFDEDKMHPAFELRGIKIDRSFMDKDVCTLETLTHDMELVSRLEEKLRRFYSLQLKVHDNYNSWNYRRHPCAAYVAQNLTVTVKCGEGSTKWVLLGQEDAHVSGPEESRDNEHKRTRTETNPKEMTWVNLKELNLDHFSEPCRDENILEFIRAQADLTVKMSVSQFSKDRPKKFQRENDEATPGSGLIKEVITYTEEDGTNCVCRECIHSSSPQKVWGRITLETVPDVVYDQTEASCCTWELFHGKSPPISLRTMRLYTLFVDLDDRRRTLFYATHNMDLIKKLEDLLFRRMELYKKIENRRGESSLKILGTRDLNHRLAVIVSHPHGMGKRVTVGELVRRTVIQTRQDGVEATQYEYTTPTCRGCSGAPVFTFENVFDFWYHPHSHGNVRNNSASSTWWDSL